LGSTPRKIQNEKKKVSFYSVTEMLNNYSLFSHLVIQVGGMAFKNMFLPMIAVIIFCTWRIAGNT